MVMGPVKTIFGISAPVKFLIKRDMRTDLTKSGHFSEKLNPKEKYILHIVE